MADRNQEILRHLLERALALPAASRAAFLERACSGDASLKQRARERLHAAEVEREPDPSAVDAPSELREGPGSHIGPYQLLEQIGEGGLGVVFLAEQRRPVARQVALKVIKAEMDTRQVVARFEQERQALAIMDHPHIARVIDGGATETGRPYFVMELVQGEPITAEWRRKLEPSPPAAPGEGR